MSRWQCTRFPAGVAHIRTPAGAVVDFVDGEAQVDDPALDEGLRQVPEVFGLVEQAGQDAPVSPGAPDRPDPPPRHGKGSGLDAWSAYAMACGVPVPDGASRDQVIEALSAVGVPTERE